MRGGEGDVKAFKFKSLFVDVENKKLVINGKEIPFEGISEFSLTWNCLSEWQLSGKRDLMSEITEAIAIETQQNCEEIQQKP